MALKCIKVTNAFTTNMKITFAILCLYMDDLLIFCSNIHVVNNVKSLLSVNFDMKDLGEAKVILVLGLKREFLLINFTTLRRF